MASSGYLLDAADIAIAANGDLFVLDPSDLLGGGSQIIRIVPSTGGQTRVATFNKPFDGITIARYSVPSRCAGSIDFGPAQKNVIPDPNQSQNPDISQGDFNGDGAIELVAVANPSRIIVFLNEGSGTFGPGLGFPTGVLDPVGITTADFNGDGKLDVVVAGIDSASVSILLGDGNGSFSAPLTFTAGAYPAWPVAGVFNGDGKMDLLVSNIWSASVSLLLGDGKGQLRGGASYEVGHNPLHTAVGEFNEDVAIANGQDFFFSVLYGDGTGSLRSRRDFADNREREIQAAEFNGDGKLDLALSGSTYQPESRLVTVLLGDGTGSFRPGPILETDPHSPSSSPQTTSADFDRDGNTDLAVIAEGNVNVFLGDGNGNFGPRLSFPIGGGHVHAHQLRMRPERHALEPVLRLDERRRQLQVYVHTSTAASTRSHPPFSTTMAAWLPNQPPRSSPVRASKTGFCKSSARRETTM